MTMDGVCVSTIFESVDVPIDEYCVPTSRTSGRVRGCTNLASYSFRTSL